MKEEWRSAAMECGGLFIPPVGTVLMLELFVGNWDYIRHIPVCIARRHTQNECACTGIIIIIIIIIGVEVFRSNSYFGAGTGPVLFAHLNCIGTESTLSDCSTSSSYPFGIGHYDAGVRCNGVAVTGKPYTLTCLPMTWPYNII